MNSAVRIRRTLPTTITAGEAQCNRTGTNASLCRLPQQTQTYYHLFPINVSHRMMAGWEREWQIDGGAIEGEYRRTTREGRVIYCCHPNPLLKSIRSGLAGFGKKWNPKVHTEL